MSILQHSRVKPIAASIAGVAVATILTLGLRPLFGGKAPLTFFALAVIFGGVYGGLPAGFLATALSAVIAITVLHDRIVILLAPSGVGLFVAFGVAASAILEGLHRKNAALAETRAELENANQKLRQHAAALAKTNEELHHFAYALAHDLNAPLRGISTLTDLFVERNQQYLDATSKECAALLVDKVARMRAMIRSLLDYAAAVDGRDERVMADCNTVLARALKDLETDIRLSGARVTSDRLPTLLINDSLLVQVFSNLLSNAIKYRVPGRSPEIHVSAGDEKDQWLFRVQDNGIGIDMQYADEIFQMFKRLHGSTQYDGSGIGLALCKIVIERHGGRIWVESEPGRGSNFCFLLPKLQAGRQELPSETAFKASQAV